MSAHYYKGTATFHCYHDCRQEGCPSHTITLREKHGGLIVTWRETTERGAPVPEHHLAFDAPFYLAIGKLLRGDGDEEKDE